MDRFDLRWPKTDATFFTDGCRCRIVWRQKGGMGGTIDNNVQCVTRVAQSLDGAPYLLGALKARGHVRLATQIESLVAEQPSAPVLPVRRPAATPVRKPVRAQQKPDPVTVATPKPVPKPKAAPRKPAARSPGADWLERLSGSTAFETAKNRRAKVWIELGVCRFDTGEETLFLKTPAQRGKQEWVLKRSWAESGRKAEYIAAEAFKGIATYLIGAGADDRFIESMLGACGDPEAVSAWRSAARSFAG